MSEAIEKGYCPKCGLPVKPTEQFMESGARRYVCPTGHRCNANTLTHVDKSNGPRVLLLDIETAPMLGYLWSLWQDGIQHDQIYRDWHILTWSARWLGDKETMSDSMWYDENYRPWSEDDSRPVRSLWKLMDEADWIIWQNGDKFDRKKMNTRFILLGLHPPSPYKSIDTLKIATREFNFTSNKLDYLATKLCGFGKVKHEGHVLWRECLVGKKEAWEKMMEYNIGDIDTLEAVYFAMRAWDRQHPSFIIQTDSNDHICTVCGSPAKPTGKTVKTNVSEFQAFQCTSCGHHMRGRRNVRPGVIPLVNAA